MSVQSQTHNLDATNNSDDPENEIAQIIDNWSGDWVQDIPRVVLDHFPDLLNSQRLTDTVPLDVRGAVWGLSQHTDQYNSLAKVQYGIQIHAIDKGDMALVEKVKTYAYEDASVSDFLYIPKSEAFALVDQYRQHAAMAEFGENDGNSFDCEMELQLPEATAANESYVEYIKGLPLNHALWWFIENISDDHPERAVIFFALRERIRAEGLSPRTLITVSGGVADWVCDDGVQVELFDWDNYNGDPINTRKVPANFQDLAKPLDIPVARC